MQTKEQIEQAFRAELQALLDKYGAELEAKDHFQGYAECGEDVRMTVDVPALYDHNHNCVREYTEIDLGRWMCPTPISESTYADGMTEEDDRRFIEITNDTAPNSSYTTGSDA